MFNIFNTIINKFKNRNEGTNPVMPETRRHGPTITDNFRQSKEWCKNFFGSMSDYFFRSTEYPLSDSRRAYHESRGENPENYEKRGLVVRGILKFESIFTYANIKNVILNSPRITKNLILNAPRTTKNLILNAPVKIKTTAKSIWTNKTYHLLNNTDKITKQSNNILRLATYNYLSNINKLINDDVTRKFVKFEDDESKGTGPNIVGILEPVEKTPNEIHYNLRLEGYDVDTRHTEKETKRKEKYEKAYLTYDFNPNKYYKSLDTQIEIAKQAIIENTNSNSNRLGSRNITKWSKLVENSAAQNQLSEISHDFNKLVDVLSRRHLSAPKCQQVISKLDDDLEKLSDLRSSAADTFHKKEIELLDLILSSCSNDEEKFKKFKALSSLIKTVSNLNGYAGGSENFGFDKTRNLNEFQKRYLNDTFIFEAEVHKTNAAQIKRILTARKCSNQLPRMAASPILQNHLKMVHDFADNVRHDLAELNQRFTEDPSFRELLYTQHVESTGDLNITQNEFESLFNDNLTEISNLAKECDPIFETLNLNNNILKLNQDLNNLSDEKLHLEECLEDIEKENITPLILEAIPASVEEGEKSNNYGAWTNERLESKELHFVSTSDQSKITIRFNQLIALKKDQQNFDMKLITQIEQMQHCRNELNRSLNSIRRTSLPTPDSNIDYMSQTMLELQDLSTEQQPGFSEESEIYNENTLLSELTEERLAEYYDLDGPINVEPDPWLPFDDEDNQPRVIYLSEAEKEAEKTNEKELELTRENDILVTEVSGNIHFARSGRDRLFVVDGFHGLVNENFEPYSYDGRRLHYFDCHNELSPIPAITFVDPKKHKVYVKNTKPSKLTPQQLFDKGIVELNTVEQLKLADKELIELVEKNPQAAVNSGEIDINISSIPFINFELLKELDYEHRRVIDPRLLIKPANKMTTWRNNQPKLTEYQFPKTTNDIINSKKTILEKCIDIYINNNTTGISSTMASAIIAPYAAGVKYGFYQENVPPIVTLVMLSGIFGPGHILSRLKKSNGFETLDERLVKAIEEHNNDKFSPVNTVLDKENGIELVDWAHWNDRIPDSGSTRLDSQKALNNIEAAKVYNDVMRRFKTFSAYKQRCEAGGTTLLKSSKKALKENIKDTVTKKDLELIKQVNPKSADFINKIDHQVYNETPQFMPGRQPLVRETKGKLDFFETNFKEPDGCDYMLTPLTLTPRALTATSKSMMYLSKVDKEEYSREFSINSKEFKKCDDINYSEIAHNGLKILSYYENALGEIKYKIRFHRFTGPGLAISLPKLVEYNILNKNIDKNFEQSQVTYAISSYKKFMTGRLSDKDYSALIKNYHLEYHTNELHKHCYNAFKQERSRMIAKLNHNSVDLNYLCRKNNENKNSITELPAFTFVSSDYKENTEILEGPLTDHLQHMLDEGEDEVTRLTTASPSEEPIDVDETYRFTPGEHLFEYDGSVLSKEGQDELSDEINIFNAQPQKVPILNYLQAKKPKVRAAVKEGHQGFRRHYNTTSKPGFLERYYIAHANHEKRLAKGCDPLESLQILEQDEQRFEESHGTATSYHNYELNEITQIYRDHDYPPEPIYMIDRFSRINNSEMKAYFEEKARNPRFLVRGLEYRRFSSDEELTDNFIKLFLKALPGQGERYRNTNSISQPNQNESFNDLVQVATRIGISEVAGLGQFNFELEEELANFDDSDKEFLNFFFNIVIDNTHLRLPISRIKQHNLINNLDPQTLLLFKTILKALADCRSNHDVIKYLKIYNRIPQILGSERNIMIFNALIEEQKKIENNNLPDVRRIEFIKKNVDMDVWWKNNFPKYSETRYGFSIILADALYNLVVIRKRQPLKRFTCDSVLFKKQTEIDKFKTKHLIEKIYRPKTTNTFISNRFKSQFGLFKSKKRGIENPKFTFKRLFENIYLFKKSRIKSSIREKRHIFRKKTSTKTELIKKPTFTFDSKIYKTTKLPKKLKKKPSFTDDPKLSKKPLFTFNSKESKKPLFTFNSKEPKKFILFSKPTKQPFYLSVPKNTKFPKKPPVTLDSNFNDIEKSQFKFVKSFMSTETESSVKPLIRNKFDLNDSKESNLSTETELPKKSPLTFGSDNSKELNKPPFTFGSNISAETKLPKKPIAVAGKSRFGKMGRTLVRKKNDHTFPTTKTPFIFGSNDSKESNLSTETESKKKPLFRNKFLFKFESDDPFEPKKSPLTFGSDNSKELNKPPFAFGPNDSKESNLSTETELPKKSPLTFGANNSKESKKPMSNFKNSSLSKLNEKCEIVTNSFKSKVNREKKFDRLSNKSNKPSTSLIKMISELKYKSILEQKIQKQSTSNEEGIVQPPRSTNIEKNPDSNLDAKTRDIISKSLNKLTENNIIKKKTRNPFTSKKYKEHISKQNSGASRSELNEDLGIKVKSDKPLSHNEVLMSALFDEGLVNENKPYSRDPFKSFNARKSTASSESNNPSKAFKLLDPFKNIQYLERLELTEGFSPDAIINFYHLFVPTEDENEPSDLQKELLEDLFHRFNIHPRAKDYLVDILKKGIEQGYEAPHVKYLDKELILDLKSSPMPFDKMSYLLGNEKQVLGDMIRSFYKKNQKIARGFAAPSIDPKDLHSLGFNPYNNIHCYNPILVNSIPTKLAFLDTLGKNTDWTIDQLRLLLTMHHSPCLKTNPEFYVKIIDEYDLFDTDVNFRRSQIKDKYNEYNTRLTEMLAHATSGYSNSKDVDFLKKIDELNKLRTDLKMLEAFDFSKFKSSKIAQKVNENNKLRTDLKILEVDIASKFEDLNILQKLNENNELLTDLKQLETYMASQFKDLNILGKSKENEELLTDLKTLEVDIASKFEDLNISQKSEENNKLLTDLKILEVDIASKFEDLNIIQKFNENNRLGAEVKTLEGYIASKFEFFTIFQKREEVIKLEEVLADLKIQDINEEASKLDISQKYDEINKLQIDQKILEASDEGVSKLNISQKFKEINELRELLIDLKIPVTKEVLKSQYSNVFQKIGELKEFRQIVEDLKVMEASEVSKIKVLKIRQSINEVRKIHLFKSYEAANEVSNLKKLILHEAIEGISNAHRQKLSEMQYHISNAKDSELSQKTKEIDKLYSAVKDLRTQGVDRASQLKALYTSMDFKLEERNQLLENGLEKFNGLQNLKDLKMQKFNENFKDLKNFQELQNLQNLKKQKFDENLKDLEDFNVLQNLQNLKKQKFDENFKDLKDFNDLQNLKDLKMQKFDENLKDLEDYDELENLEDLKRQELDKTFTDLGELGRLTRQKFDEGLKILKESKIQKLNKIVSDLNDLLTSTADQLVNDLNDISKAAPYSDKNDIKARQMVDALLKLPPDAPYEDIFAKLAGANIIDAELEKSRFDFIKLFMSEAHNGFTPTRAAHYMINNYNCLSIRSQKDLLNSYIKALVHHITDYKFMGWMAQPATFKDTPKILKKMKFFIDIKEIKPFTINCNLGEKNLILSEITNYSKNHSNFYTKPIDLVSLKKTILEDKTLKNSDSGGEEKAWFFDSDGDERAWFSDNNEEGKLWTFHHDYYKKQGLIFSHNGKIVPYFISMLRFNKLISENKKVEFFSENLIDITTLIKHVYSLDDLPKNLSPNNSNIVRPFIETPDSLIRKKLFMIFELFNDLIVDLQVMYGLEISNVDFLIKLFTQKLPNKEYTTLDLLKILMINGKMKIPTLNDKDRLIYKLLANQKIESQVKSNIIQYFLSGFFVNGFNEYVNGTLDIDILHFLLAKNFKVEDKSPYLDSPLKHVGAKILIRVNDGINYTFNFLGVKGHLTQITVFTHDSYISLFHILKSKHSNLKKKYFIPKFVNKHFHHFGGVVRKIKIKSKSRFLLKKIFVRNHERDSIQKTLLVRNNTQCYFIKRYKSNKNYQINHDIYLITGDNKPVQVFTQLSSYKELINPALRSLLQFDFGYININDIQYKSSMNSKFNLNIDYKIHVDKSFSAAPKIGLLISFTEMTNANISLIFSHLIKQFKDYESILGLYLRRNIRNFLFKIFKLNELNHNSFNLKFLFLSGNLGVYPRKNLKTIIPQWRSSLLTSELMKLTAQWVYMYRNREFSKNINKQVYSMLKKYNTVDKVYAAPFKNYNPLKPVSFQSTYRYILFHKFKLPHANLAYLPKFIFQDKQFRLIKIFANLNTSRSRLQKQFEYFIYRRDYRFYKQILPKLSKNNIEKPSFQIPHLKIKNKTNYNLKELESHIFNTKYENLIQKNSNNNLNLSTNKVANLNLNQLKSLFGLLYNNMQVETTKINTLTLTNLSKLRPSVLAPLHFYQLLEVKNLDYDPTYYANLIYIMIPFYEIYNKKQGSAVYHNNMFLPYRLYKKQTNGERFFFDLIVHGNKTFTAYWSPFYTSIFVQYLWGKNSITRFKPLVNTTPTEMLLFFKGTYLTLVNEINYKNLFETTTRGNKYAFLFKYKNIPLTQFKFSELSNYILKSTTNLFNLTTIHVFDLFKIRIYELTKLSGGVIMWSLQNNRLFCKLLTPNFRNIAKFRMKRLNLTPFINNVETPQFCGTSTRPEIPLHNTFFLNIISRLRTEKDYYIGNYDKIDTFKNFIELKTILKKEQFKPTKIIKKFKKLKKKPFKFSDANATKWVSTNKKKRNFFKLKYHMNHPYPGSVKQKITIKSVASQGLDWQITNSTTKHFPLILHPAFHLPSRVGEFVATDVQIEPLKTPTRELKEFKSVENKQKELDQVSKGVLAEFYEAVSDFLKTDSFSWITFHQYREELIRNQTEQMPLGIFTQIVHALIQATLCTFTLYAADYRRAPNTKSAARLASCKFFIIFCIFTIIFFCLIHYAGIDLVAEVIKLSEYFFGLFGERRIPQPVMTPVQVNFTSDLHDLSLCQTPHFSKHNADLNIRAITSKVFKFLGSGKWT